MRSPFALALLLLATAPAPAAAQLLPDGRAIGAVIGVTRAEGRTGVSFPLIVSAGSGRWLGSVLAEWSIVPRDDDDRYALESPAGGASRCRDRETGELVDVDRCDGGPDNEFAASAEVTWALDRGPTTPFVGAGYRAGWGTTPYATAGWIVGGRRSRTVLRVSGGDDFLQGSVGFYWYLR